MLPLKRIILAWNLLIVLCVGLRNAYLSGDFLLAADGTNAKIHQISLSTGQVEELNISGLTFPVGVLYDKDDQFVIVSDHNSKTLIRCTLSGELCKSFSTGRGYPDRVAIDYSTGNIFYSADNTPSSSSTTDGYIGVINPKKNAHLYLLGGLRAPRDIVLYPSKGWMFWGDHSSPDDHIGRSKMDGKGSTRIVTSNSIWPNGLAIDFNNDRLYWVDGSYNTLQSSDLNGGNRYVLYTDSGSRMRDVLVKGSYLYIAALYNKFVRKIRKSDYAVMSWMSSNSQFGNIYAIDAYPSDTQPLHSTCSIDNGGCSVFCLPSGTTSRTCYCDGGIGLNYNNFYSSPCDSKAAQRTQITTGSTIMGTSIVFLLYNKVIRH